MARQTDISVKNGRVSRPRTVEPPFVIRVQGIEGPPRRVVEQDFRQKLLSGHYAQRNFYEEPKTRFDRALIHASIRALNAVRGNLGLEPIALPLEHFHLLSEDEYIQMFEGAAETGGLTAFREMYIRHCSRRADLARRITHELAHAACFHQYTVAAQIVEPNDQDCEALEDDDDNEEDCGGVLIKSIRHDRSGLQLAGKKFQGLDEAITEILASLIRSRMIADRHPLSKAAVEELTTYCSYLPQISVIFRVISDLYEKREVGLAVLIWDYLTGSNDFCRRLRRRDRQMHDLIRQMGDEPEDALRTALALGYCEEAEEIAEDFSDTPDEE
ncbi:hypothetical protein KKF05_04920 [Patescibacteria group bacterium]|nr:hypothetical protein [Patescibacteria group bacterium]MBU1028892.1 hypothetical protein [Patescibacteria group bacterium]